MHGDGKTSRLRITIAYATAGLSGARKNLQYRKPEWGQDKYQQLPHKATILQLDDKTIDNTANRADHPSISFWSFTDAYKFVKRIANLVITY